MKTLASHCTYRQVEIRRSNKLISVLEANPARVYAKIRILSDGAYFSFSKPDEPYDINSVPGLFTTGSFNAQGTVEYLLTFSSDTIPYNGALYAFGDGTLSILECEI